tara:strand:- start:96 stop:263 length:168 start_codon:yes stop_codon:yes gene_type:complete
MGQKEGYGIYKWPAGQRYEGYWKEDVKHGVGTVYNQKWITKKTGLWEDGKRIKWK